MPTPTASAGIHWKPAERIGLVLAVSGFFLAGYYGMAWLHDPAGAGSLRTTLDDAIPFWPDSVLVYAWVYPAVFLPGFVVGCPRLFRRTIAAYASLIAVALVCFALFPVTATGLRAPVESLDPARFVEWGTAVLYRLDPPMNLFPSLHLGLAAVGAIACARARPRVGALAFALLVPVSVAVCTVKQHYAVDAAAGLVLAGILGRLLIAPYRPSPSDQPAMPVVGLAAFGALLALFYGGFAAAFLSGL